MAGSSAETAMAYPELHPASSAPQAILAMLIHRALRIPGILDAALAPRCPDQAARLGAKMAHDGLKRLPAADLEHRAAILLHLLQEPDETVCAALLRGGAADHPALSQRITHVLMRLPRHLLDNWINISLAAMAAELRGAPEFVPDAPALALALQRAFGHLPQREYMRLFSALRAPRNQPDRPLCMAARTVYTQVLAASAADRALLLRALLPANAPLMVVLRRSRAHRPRELSRA
jgi:hypothetical protein